MSDSNPLKSIQPLFVQAIQDADINCNSKLNSNTHRIDIIKLRNQNNEIDGYNCTSIDEYTINCLFNLTSITQDSILEIYYKKRYQSSMFNSNLTVNVLKICSDLRVRDEYDNYICHTCKERELETPLFQNYRCVEECDNKTYYKSALKENYCVHCKDEGTYLYEEENKCVLDCNDIEGKENYEKNKLCVKRTPICPENYCLNNGVCVVINKELTCDCPDFFFGDLCEYEIDTSNYNELSKFFEETVDLINDNDTVIHNQSTLNLSQTMRIITFSTNSSDSNKKEIGINLFNDNIDNFATISTYTQNIFSRIAENELKITNDLEVKSLFIFASTTIFYLTRSSKPELLTRNNSDISSNRNVKEIQQLQNELSNLLKNIHQANIYIFKHLEFLLSDSSLYFQISEDLMISFVAWTSDLTSNSMYKIKSLSLDIPILEHNIDSDGPINYYVETAFTNDVLYSLDKISPSMIAYFSMFNASFIEQKIYDIKITFSINKQFYSILNETSIEFYNKRGIDPYNKSNEAFTEVCYRSINFEYDSRI